MAAAGHEGQSVEWRLFVFLTVLHLSPRWRLNDQTLRPRSCARSGATFRSRPWAARRAIATRARASGHMCTLVRAIRRARAAAAPRDARERVQSLGERGHGGEHLLRLGAVCLHFHPPDKPPLANDQYMQ